MVDKLPLTVHFQITSQCNNNCKHCFGPDRTRPDMPIPQIKKMISIVKDGGAENIHLTGGEPLIRKEFDKIIEVIKRANLNIFMDTNCDFFFDRKDVIGKNVSVIGIPIDFPDNSWRNGENLNNVLKVLKYFEKQKNKPKIRILTTITQENINQLEDIGKLLKNFKFDVWRIFQFLPLKESNAQINQKQLEVSKKQFLEATSKVTEKFKRYFKINIVTLGHRNHAYFIITSDGYVMIQTESRKICENKIVGNVFDKDIIDKWINYGSHKNFTRSTKEIFDLIK